jgi:hypothetical protein
MPLCSVWYSCQREAVHKYEPEVFRDSLLALIQSVDKNDNDTYTSILEANESKLDLKRYAEPFFELFIVGDLLGKFNWFNGLILKVLVELLVQEKNSPSPSSRRLWMVLNLELILSGEIIFCILIFKQYGPAPQILSQEIGRND